VRSDLFGAARFLVLPTLALLGLALLAPGRLELGFRIYALVVAATAIALVLLALRRAYPPETVTRPRVTRRPARRPPPALARIEHEVALAVAGAFDVHYRLVPRLRAVAAGLLSSRRGVSLEASPDRARAMLGEEAWELVRPGRPAPEDRLGPGIPAHELERVVDALEAV
jgi:hypothetical protein